MFTRALDYKNISLFAALVYLAGCAGNGNPPAPMPAGPTLGHGEARTLTVGYSIADLCPAQGSAPCGVGGGGGLPTFDESEGSINNSGQAVGQSTNAKSQPTAALFDHGKITNLNTLGAINSAGDAINDSGQVAGVEATKFDDPASGHAFLYSNGKMTDIENASLFPNGSQAYGINKSAQVVGVGFVSGSVFHAFLYSGGKMVDLKPFNGFQSIAWSINDSGEIVGQSCCSPTSRTWLFANGKFTNLSSTNSGVFINNEGQIVGQNGAFHAALYSNGVWTDLGAFQGHSTTAVGINNHGQIVGYAPIFKRNNKCPSCGLEDESRALVFTSSGPVDLNTLIPPSSGFTVREAGAVNDAGQIVAEADNGSGVPHAVLLTPK